MSARNNRDKDNDASRDGIICTKILQVQNKRYYFDVKEHDYGRFLKLAETAQSGRKSRLVIPMYVVPEIERVVAAFAKKLEELPNFEKRDMGGMGDHTGDNSKTEPAVEYLSDLIERGRRRYYFNLKENTRGRYLRLKAIGDIPQNLPGRSRRGSRVVSNGRPIGRGRRNTSTEEDRQPRAIILPAVGVEPFREILAKLWKEYSVNVDDDQVALADKNIESKGTANEKLPQSGRFASQQFRKVIFVDGGENSRGTFARVTEQQNSYRESITVPSVHFQAMGEWFLKAAELLTEEEKLNNRMNHLSVEGSFEDGQHIDEEDTDASGEVDVVVNGNLRRNAASDSDE